MSSKCKTETVAFAKLDKALRSPRWQKHSSALIYRSTKATADLAANKGPNEANETSKANEPYLKRVAILNVPVQCEAQAQMKAILLPVNARNKMQAYGEKATEKLNEKFRSH